MKELTRNNHFKFGYNDEWFNFRQTKNDQWKIKYGRCSREPYSFRKECIETTRLIRDTTNLPINIFFSGGVDSEIVVRSFLSAGIEANIIICEFENELNKHDVSYAFEFCKENSLKFEVVKLDVLNFWKQNLYKSSIETKCISPQFPVIMWITSQKQGYNILGSGECFLERENNKWFMWEREKVASLFKHYIINNVVGCPGFFQYTPELILSFLEHTIIKDMVKNERVEVNTYPFKKLVYKDSWNDLKEREKYNGFEFLENEDKKYRRILNHLFPNCDSIYKTEYYRLIDMLAPVVVKEITKEEMSKYKSVYEDEKLHPFRTPFSSDIDYSMYFAAYIRGKIAGLTSFDVLKNKQIYQHAALTLPRYRMMEINNTMWKYKMNKIKDFANEDTELISINPDWIPGAKIMGEKLQRIGFKICGNRPDGAKFLKVKFMELSDV